MSLFSRNRKKKMDSEAMAALEAQRQQSPPQTIHNHQPGLAGTIFASVGAGILVIGIAWGALVYFLWLMDSPRPWRDAAVLVFYGALIVGGLRLLSWLANPYVNGWYTFQLEVKREETRQKEVELLSVQTAIQPGRMSEADYQFARVILSVMALAYDWLDKEDYDKFPSRWRPWSLSESKKTAEMIGVKISQDKANEVSKWLAARGVITDPSIGQITPAYPNLSNVSALIDREFGKPIRVVSPTIRENRGFKFTE